MSKTFTYVLLVIGAYILIIFPKVAKATNEKNEDENEETKKEGEPETGAKGQLKYRFGVTM